jgi:O-antigen ligase/Flp pilus assembly protein TadD
MYRLFSRLVLLAMLGAMPLMLNSGVDDVFFGPWRAFLLASLACLAVWLGVRAVGGRALLVLSPACLPWALFAAWALASAARSSNPGDGWRRALELTGSVAGVWLGIALARQTGRAVSIVLWAISICSLYGMLQVLGIDPLPWSTKFGARAFGTLGNPDYYAGHVLLVLPLAFVLVARRSSAITFGMIALLLAGFIFSQVRGAWLAGGAGAAWAAFWIYRGGILRDAERKFLVRTGWTALAIAVVALAFSPDVRSRVLSVVAVGGYDATGRRYLWTIAALIWRDAPLLGFGPDSYQLEFPRHQLVGMDMGLAQFRPYGWSTHAHNELLQFGAELGAVGVALFLWGALAWFVRWAGRMKELSWRGDDQDRDEWWIQLGIGTSLAASFAYGFVNFPFQVAPTAVLWWALLGISLGRMGETKREWKFPYALGAVAGAGLAAIGLAGAIIFSADMVGSSYLRGLRGRLEIGNNALARRYGLLAARIIPHDIRVFRHLGRLAVAEGDEPFLEWVTAARLRIHPHLADAYLDRADLMRKLGRNEEAEKRYRELLEGAPNFASAWGELGAISFERREYAKAAEAFARAADIQRHNAVWPHNQASALGCLKMYREALEADNQAIERDPRFVDAYVGKALSARALKDLVTAREAARKAYQLDPADSRAARLLSQLGG